MLPQTSVKQSLGIIGTGAFGGFMVRHLAPHYDVTLYDAQRDVAALARNFSARAGDFRQAAACDVVVIAVPVQRFEEVLRDLATVIRPGALVIDVASIKMRPTELMTEHLPPTVDIVGTHPLFGPQSGKDGIEGLNIAVCDVRGERGEAVCRFLRNELKLNVMRATAEEHDRELAYVQGLTHLLAKVVVALELPKFRFTTRTYEYMEKMVEMVRYDSEELFRAIEKENPFAAQAKQAFFAAARKLEEDLNRG
ncbi:MAG: prephenate dehydrogenase [Pseudomonadota bacterium]|nr:prephenate dehydrogenase [Pseudomonadota bacterium]